MIKKIIRFFDKLEDHVRARLSRTPITYALIGGAGIVLFWKGVWEVAEDISGLHGVASVILGVLILLPTGLMVSFFIGDNIILSGYKREKKLVEKTEDFVKSERTINELIVAKLESLERSVAELKSRQP
jgi:hypothetical protein